MTKAKKTALIAALNQRLRAHGSWCGETHIQKAMYFLQELAGVKTDFDFILYKHGPFSFDLRDLLGEMRADQILVVQQQPYPYGPSLVVPPEQERTLQRRFPHTLRRYSDRLEFVGSELGRKRVSELERLATALYVTRENPSAPVNTRARELTTQKPHISFDEAVEAVRAVNEMDSRAESLRRSRITRN
jgi:hypothetical protein